MVKIMLKKVYVEITNVCNLKCDFCIQNKRIKKFMTIPEFKIILDKLKGHTRYLYFHILGEPLLHPQILSLINMAYENGFFVNITTNAYLITRIKYTTKIRQLNISLHSYSSKYNISLEDYMKEIFSVCDNIDNTYISYRLWVKGEYTNSILDCINKHYHTNFSMEDINSNIKINNHIFINNFHEFIWPDLDNDYYSKEGRCYALRDHIGILSDGTVVPCCLDTKGIINLGNIFTDSLEDILNSDRVMSILSGFKCGKKNEELCRHCYFIDK